LPSQHHQPRLARHEQEQRGDHREAGKADQCGSRAVPLRGAPNGPRQHRAAEQHQGDGAADTSRAKAQVAQVERKDDTEEAVAERPDRLRGEDRGDIESHGAASGSP